MTPMMAAIIQNTPGYSEAYPAGVPRTFSWCAGTPGDSRPPPPNFTAVTAWGQVYPRAGDTASAQDGARIEIAHARTYVRLKPSGAWVLVQNQADQTIEGGHFVADFSGNRAVPMTIEVRPDGSTSIGFPPLGFNSHFWIAARGTFPAGGVDGVYVQMEMRTTDTDARPVANIGADWWRDASAGYVAGFNNNPGAGVSNWVTLTPRWSTLYFYSLKPAEFRTSPPPPLAGSTIEGTITPPARPAGPSPCQLIPRQDLRVAAGIDPPPAPARDATLDRSPSIMRREPARQRLHRR